MEAVTAKFGDRYEARRRHNGQGLALTRATRRNSRPVRLTPRGESVLVAVYTLGAILAWGLFLLGTIGLAGWIEGLP